MLLHKRDRPINSKRKTPCERRRSNYQKGHDNEVSSLEELHKNMEKVQVPETIKY